MRATARAPAVAVFATLMVGLSGTGSGPAAADSSTQPEDPQVPPPRYWTRAAYDSESDRLILFGGGNVTGLNDTWAYDMTTNSWEEMRPARSPSARMGHAMAYDSQSDRVILFGGVSVIPPCAAQFTTPMLDDTWAYDYNADTWTELSPTDSPVGRDLPGMAYDTRSDRVIMFGGQEEGLALKNDTWAFDYDNRTWEPMRPSIAPVARSPEAMAYDPGADRVVMFGGFSPWVDPSNDTWTYDYDSNAWTQIALLDPPPQRLYMHLAFDDAGGRLVMFGGQWDDTLSDVWILEDVSQNWTRVEPSGSPGPRAAGAFVFHPPSQRIFLFGGAVITRVDFGCYAGDQRAVTDEQWAFDATASRWISLNRPEAPEPLTLTLVSTDPARLAATVSVGWQPVTAPNGTTLGGANVYRGVDGGKLERLATGVNGSSYRDDNAVCGHPYAYAAAYNSSVGEGKTTLSQTIWVPDCPTPGLLDVSQPEWFGLLLIGLVGGPLVFLYVRRANKPPPRNLTP